MKRNPSVDRDFAPDVDMAHEIWRDVIGYDGAYQVSNWGRVKSVSRRLVFRNGQKGRLMPTRMLKPVPNKDGYLFCCLWKQSVSKNRFVHSLVLEAFVCPMPEGMECCHFPDNDKTNNRLDNLQWGSSATNGIHSIIHGSNAGTKNGRAKINDAIANEIRSIWAEGRLSKAAIGRRFGIHGSNVRRVIDRESWAAVISPAGDNSGECGGKNET